LIQVSRLPTSRTRRPRNDSKPLYEIVRVYNGSLVTVGGKQVRLRDGVAAKQPVIRTPSGIMSMDGPTLHARSEVPGSDAINAWFLELPPSRQVAIDPMFRDRERYAAFVRESEAEYANPELPDPGIPRPSRYATLFARPEDVFLSPNDGKPFVIEEFHIRFPRDGYAHDTHIVIREQEGVVVRDLRSLGKRRDRLCIGWGKQVDHLYEAIESDRD
jgi:hypothetical protein